MTGSSLSKQASINAYYDSLVIEANYNDMVKEASIWGWGGKALLGAAGLGMASKFTKPLRPYIGAAFKALNNKTGQGYAGWEGVKQIYQRAVKNNVFTKMRQTVPGLNTAYKATTSSLGTKILGGAGLAGLGLYGLGRASMGAAKWTGKKALMYGIAPAIGVAGAVSMVSKPHNSTTMGAPAQAQYY